MDETTTGAAGDTIVQADTLDPLALNGAIAEAPAALRVTATPEQIAGAVVHDLGQLGGELLHPGEAGAAPLPRPALLATGVNVLLDTIVEDGARLVQEGEALEASVPGTLAGLQQHMRDTLVHVAGWGDLLSKVMSFAHAVAVHVDRPGAGE